MSLQEFLSMGGYAAFVWPSYGLVAVVLVVNLVLPLRRSGEIRRSIKRSLRQPGRDRP